MNDNELERAISLAKSGNKAVAIKILTDLLQRDPKNVNIWLWLSFCIDDYDKKQFCLQKAKEISPNDPRIQRAFSEIKSKRLGNGIQNSSFQGSQKQEQSSVAEVTNIIINQSSSVEFIPAKCPNCGGELRIPNDHHIIKCMYCGYDIVFHDPSVARNGINISNILRLAKVAEKGENFLDAYQGYSKVLENSPDNIDAWIGKGYAAGMLSTTAKSRFDEAIACFQEAISLARDSQTDIWISLSKCALAVCEKDFQLAQQIRNSKAMEINLGTYINSPDYSFKLINDEYSSRLIQHFDILAYIWELKPSFDIGYAIDFRMGGILSIYRDDPNSLNRYKNVFLQLREKINLDSQLQTLEPSWKSEIGLILTELKQENDKEKCFIATATLGDQNHRYIQELRKFRDTVLRKSRIGNLFLASYYIISPMMANYISVNTFLRFLSLKFIVLPSVTVARYIMNHTEQPVAQITKLLNKTSAK